MRILVTGSEGFIGRAVCQNLRTHGVVPVQYDVTLGDDVHDRPHLQKATTLVDGIVHCASPCSATMFREAPDDSRRRSLDSLQSVLSCFDGRVVFPSTCTLYGDRSLGGERAIESDSVPEPAPNLYAAAKRLGERACDIYNGQHGPQAIVLRIFTGYGPGDAEKGVYASPVGRFLQCIQTGTSPVVFGSGQQCRDFVHVADVANAIRLALLLSNPSFTLFNVGTGIGTTFADLLMQMSRVWPQTRCSQYVDPPDGYVGSIVADTTRAAHVLGFRAQIALDEGLHLLHNHE